MRLAIFAGGAATLSALLALIGSAAVPATASGATATAGQAAANGTVQHVTQYVVLPAGQAAPAGAATVPPSSVAVPVATPRPRPQPVVVTSQSGQP